MRRPPYVPPGARYVPFEPHTYRSSTGAVWYWLLTAGLVLVAAAVLAIVIINWPASDAPGCGHACVPNQPHDDRTETFMISGHLTAAGLTPEADQSRGPLAGITPVVTYFSFGHGQTDPASGKRLIDHYVTVVAPTYDGCREAMFASRFGRAWSFDYLAGTARATEWIPRWTEHEVIIAPGVEKEPALLALAAAERILVDAP